MCRDISRGLRRGAGKRIVVGIVAADGDTADVHRLTSANVFVGEGGTGVADSERVTTYSIIGEGHIGSCRAVIFLVDAGGGDGQCLGRNISRGCRLGEGVVARIITAEG